MACAGEQDANAAFELIRKAGPMAEPDASRFRRLPGFPGRQAGCSAPVPSSRRAGAPPRWTSPRLWKREGRFGLRSRRVARWFWSNVGTINSEETVRVMERGVAVGTLEAAYAERLVPGDRFVLDGRAFEFRRLERSTLFARPSAASRACRAGPASSQSLSSELARELAGFRAEAGDRLVERRASRLRSWLAEVFELDDQAAAVLVELFEAQVQWSEIPAESELLVEESPSPDGPGLIYTFHAPLHRAACEALGRASSARLGRRSAAT